ncbi:MAG: heavy metal translocating P-type ATPase metal-binding domain-containing protein [Bacteroidetes bacterium]|nr:heavy metal translocating P-type ATPase metal-binding domain-containing protein [Bacteroidota bacterium]
MVPCAHCGQDCGNIPMHFEDKPFCCDGCVLVFRILKEKNLEQYYEIMPSPGIKIEKTETGSKYAFLDNEEFSSKLLSFSDGGISKITLFIPAIHCSSCIWLLENLSSLHPGIMSSFVNFVRKEVNVTFRESEISMRQLVELLHSIHYIPELTFEKGEKDDYQKVNRRYLMKIGVAGFAFGNIMLLSFPDYLPGGEQIDRILRSTFGYVAFVLALPVFLYCSSDFYLSAFKSIRKKIINIDLPISLGIIALFMESSYEIFSGHGNGYMDSLAGLLFFMLIGRWYQGKSFQSLSFDRDYKSYFPVAVTRLKEAVEEFVQLKDLKEGDLILVRNQELIPADGVVFEGEGNIDYSFVTGESVPVVKKQGDAVFAGGRQTGTGIKIRIKKEVAQSYLTQLWNEDRMSNKQSHAMQKIVNHVSHYFTIIILFIAAAAGIYWAFDDIGKAVYVFSSVLIVACPCALALTIPFTFGSLMRVFGRNGFYLKNTDVIEKIAKADTIVFDKTGTLTHSRSMKAQWEGTPLIGNEKEMIVSVARNSTHPASITICDSLACKGTSVVKNFAEIPSMGISGNVDGNTILIGSYRFVAGKDQEEKGTTTVVYVSVNHAIRGFFRIENSYREGLENVISSLKFHELHLLTGDNNSEKSNLEHYFQGNHQLHFNQSPTDKLDYINLLKQNNKHVIMIGDGLNDAGALLQSDVGITIADDIYHFSPACDVILESGKFWKLHQFLRFTKNSLWIVYASYTISFLYNIVGLTFAVQGLLSPVIAAILMPISSITIVAFSTSSIALLSRQKKM